MDEGPLVAKIPIPKQQGNIQDLIRVHGSKRRLMEAYWLGKLPVDTERFLEEFYTAEGLAHWKPAVLYTTSLADHLTISASTQVTS